MKFIVILLSVAVVYVHSWTVNYAGAKQISSPNFNYGRQGYAITCKDSSPLLIYIFSYFEIIEQVWFFTVQLVAVRSNGFKIQQVKFQHIMLLDKMGRLHKWLAKAIQHGITVYFNFTLEQHSWCQKR